MFKNKKAQAVIEIALFGAVLIFLLGVILRTHLSSTFNTDHQARALKLALQMSNQSSQGVGQPANSSRNMATVLFIEDRLSPDFNKYNNIDRSAFVASGSGGMTNRLEYPVDFGEVEKNLPMMDLFINGQHFPLSTAAYVFRTLYSRSEGTGDPCGEISATDPEYVRCQRQIHETTLDTSGNEVHTFYGMEVFGTSQFNATAGNANFDLLRNNWDTGKLTCTGSMDCTTFNRFEEDVPASIRSFFTWQWRSISGTVANFNGVYTNNNVTLAMRNEDSRNYPVADASGSLREQVIYAISWKPFSQLAALLKKTSMLPYEINGNWHLLSLPAMMTAKAYTETGLNFVDSSKATYNPLCQSGPGIPACAQATWPKGVTGVVVLDYQLGDFDQTYDAKTSPGPQPGLSNEMDIITSVNQGPAGKPGTYLQIKEGKFYNPETKMTVRSISSKNHIDVISRHFQLSNNTGRFCQVNCSASVISANNDHDSCYVRPPKLIDQGNMPNPVQVCSDQCTTKYRDRTCYSPKTRILYVRTHIGNANTRKWFTDVTKGL